jgi:hypothetical protein
MNNNKTSKVEQVDTAKNDEGNSGGDLSASAIEVSEYGKKKSGKNHGPKSFEELIKAIYEGRFKRKSLSEPDRKVVFKEMSFEPSQEEIKGFANSDPSLSKTLKLMMLGIQAPELSYKVVGFAQKVMLEHELYSSQSMKDVLTNPTEAMSTRAAIDMVLKPKLPPIDGGSSEVTNTKKKLNQRRDNGVHCLLILRVSHHGASVSEIHQLLQDKLWIPFYSSGNQGDAEKLIVLLNNRDPNATSVSFSLLGGKLEELKGQARVAKQKEEKTSIELKSTQESLTKTEARLADVLSDQEKLKNELQERTQSHQTHIEHLQDDFERMRGNVLRTLKEELSLLEEGLHALKKETPKVHVMIDHAERAIDGLKDEVNRLRGGK